MGRLKYTKPERANWRKKRKMAKNFLEKNAVNISVIVLLGIFAMYVVLPGYEQYIKTDELAEGVTTTTAPAIVITAEPVYTGQNTIDVLTGDKFNPTTGLDVCCIVKVNGIRLGDIASAGTADITANTGDVIDIWCGGDETSDGDFDCQVAWANNGTNDWWFTHKTWIVPAKEQSKLALLLYPEDNTQPTITVYSDDGLSKVSSSTAYNQTVATGKHYTLKVRFSAVSEKAYGTPKILSGLDYTNVLCGHYNNTIFDDVQLRIFGTSTELPVTSAPSEFTTISSRTSTCWKIPDEIMDANENYYNFFLDMDEDDTPAGCSANICTLNFTLYDVGTFVNADTGIVTYGIQDEKGNDVGQTSDKTFEIWYSS